MTANQIIDFEIEKGFDLKKVKKYSSNTTAVLTDKDGILTISIFEYDIDGMDPFINRNYVLYSDLKLFKSLGLLDSI